MQATMWQMMDHQLEQRDGITLRQMEIRSSREQRRLSALQGIRTVANDAFNQLTGSNQHVGSLSGRTVVKSIYA